jgi:hypothetical protein
MGATNLIVDPHFQYWQPDGIASSPDRQTIYLLEFTRCSDDRKLTSPQALERKLLKYDSLLSSLRTLNPNLSIHLLTFAIGFLGTTNSSLLNAHLRALNVSPNHWDSTLQSVMTAAMSSFAKMASERTAALNLHTPPPPCIWSGRHAPLRRPPPPRRT